MMVEVLLCPFLAPCPTALSFGDTGKIISRAMMLITTERPVAVQPRVFGTLQRKRQERGKEKETERAKKSLAAQSRRER